MSKNRKKGLSAMSKLFMYGTSLEGIEQLMVMVPNFKLRRSGIVINNYFNCRGGTKDCNCNVINISKGLYKCGYIGPEFKVNVDNKRYKDLDINYISSRFIAILFLLTPDESPWKVSKYSIEQNGFDLKQVCLREINT